MAPRKFRWTGDGGATWHYDEQELPFNIPGTDVFDEVRVEPVSEIVVAPETGGTPIPPIDPPPDGCRYVVDTNHDPILYELNENGEYVIAPIGE